MILGLKNVEFEHKILLNDDEETPIRLIGAKQVPILIKVDGKPLPESLDIIRYIDNEFAGPASITDLASNESLHQWMSDVKLSLYRLTLPRWIRPQAGIAEFATPSAIDYFVKKKTAMIGDFEENFARSEDLLKDLQTHIDHLEELMVESGWINGPLSLDDFHLFAYLRSATIIKGINYPPKVGRYISFVSEQTKVPLFTDVAI